LKIYISREFDIEMFCGNIRGIFAI